MVQTVVATKLGMTQAWTNAGKRVAVTRCRVDNNVVVSEQPAPQTDSQKKIFELGYGTRKQQNMTKPLQSKLAKGGFSVGVRGIRGIKVEATEDENTIKVGDTISLQDVLQVGDVVQVQGTSKGRGFAGAIKRHGFHGGPKTHGQSDRERAVGSIGAGTYPGRVWKNKKMPGHYGVDTKSVTGLVVLHIDEDAQEVWISGPVPGHTAGFVTITKTGTTKEVELDKEASGIEVQAASTAETSETASAEESSDTNDTTENK